MEMAAWARKDMYMFLAASEADGMEQHLGRTVSHQCVDILHWQASTNKRQTPLDAKKGT